MKSAYSTLAEKLGYPESERLENILRKLMDEEEARLVVALPAPVEELSSQLGKPVAEVNRQLEKLFRKGIIFMTSKGYQFARHLTQLHDATASDTRLDGLWGRGLLELWKDFGEEEWYAEVADLIKKAGEQGTPPMRIIPARQAIAPGANVPPTEDVNTILEKATRLAVVHCPCRRVAQQCGRPVEVCLQLNRAAEYAIARGTGRELTKKEAMEVMEMAAEGGLIHTISALSETPSEICNCCTDCCVLYYPCLKYGVLDKGVAKSGFRAKVDLSLCNGCQECVERCQFEAVDMIRVTGEKKLKAQVNSESCYGCGICAVGCEVEAIKLIEVRPLQSTPA